MNPKAHKKPPKTRERSASYDVGLLLLASHLDQLASSAENLQLFRIHLFAFGLLELSRHNLHHGTKRIGQGSIC